MDMLKLAFVNLTRVRRLLGASTLSTASVRAQLLRRSKSALVLMDVSTELPDLRRTKGLTNWLVKGQSKFYSKWEEAIEEAVRPSAHSPHLQG